MRYSFRAHRDVVLASRLLTQTENALLDAARKLDEVDTILGRRGRRGEASDLRKLVKAIYKRIRKLKQSLW